MHVETGLSPALTLKAACVGKNALFRYFEKNMGVKGLLMALGQTHTQIHARTYRYPAERGCNL